MYKKSQNWWGKVKNIVNPSAEENSLRKRVYQKMQWLLTKVLPSLFQEVKVSGDQLDPSLMGKMQSIITEHVTFLNTAKKETKDNPANPAYFFSVFLLQALSQFVPDINKETMKEQLLDLAQDMRTAEQYAANAHYKAVQDARRQQEARRKGKPIPPGGMSLPKNVTTIRRKVMENIYNPDALEDLQKYFNVNLGPYIQEAKLKLGIP